MISAIWNQDRRFENTEGSQNRGCKRYFTEKICLTRIFHAIDPCGRGSTFLTYTFGNAIIPPGYGIKK